jgi:serine/threonine-protein kinase HipA
MNKIQKIILDTFEEQPEQNIAIIVEKTAIARRTVQRYLEELVKEGRVQAIGEGRGRYYQRIYVNEELVTHIAVLKNNEHIGTLHYGEGFYSFDYENSFKELLTGIKKDDNKSAKLYPVFENLIPEHHRRDKLSKESNNLADVLVKLYNSHGDFSFVYLKDLFKYTRSNIEERPSWITNKHKILSENEYPNIINAMVAIPEDILDDASDEEYSNLSGYQHKIDIDLGEDVIVLNRKDAQYLMKPLNRTLTNYFERDDNNTKRYYPFLALNEHLFMSFAKNELKMDVPMTGVVKAKEGDFHYITKRYDRFDDYHYGQYDMAQIMDIASEKKYQSNTEEVLNIFKEKVFDDKSKEDMLKFQVFSSLIKHSDLHVKNMGILEVGKQKYINAPLYDVISVGVYNGEADDLGLPLSKNNRKRKKLDFKDMMAIGKILGVGEVRSKAIIRNTVETYLDRFPEYIARTQKLEEVHSLKMKHTRIGTKAFSNRLQSLYEEKKIELKKLGVLQDLGIVDKYGGVLNREKVQKPKTHKHK